jgi:hypothetical protein
MRHQTIIKYCGQYVLWRGGLVCQYMTYALIAVIKNKITDLTPAAINHIAVVSDLGQHF